LRGVRLVVPDGRSAAVRARVAAHLAGLDARDEEDALRWIEAVSVYDEPGLVGRRTTS